MATWQSNFKGEFGGRQLKAIGRAVEYANDPYGEPSHLLYMVIAELAKIADAQELKISDLQAQLAFKND